MAVYNLDLSDFRTIWIYNVWIAKGQTKIVHLGLVSWKLQLEKDAWSS